MDLLSLRDEIDGIDEELLKLLLQRQEISKRIAEYKAAHGIPVTDSKREKEILQKIAENSSDSEYAKKVFLSVIEASRELQTKITEEE